MDFGGGYRYFLLKKATEYASSPPCNANKKLGTNRIDVNKIKNSSRTVS